ncbi:unnamed protein product, partial [Urochloa humidicola]
GSKARQVAGGFGVLQQGATTANLRLLALRLPSDRHGGDGWLEQCGGHGDDGLAGPASRRCRRVPEQQEEDPQRARPYSQQACREDDDRAAAKRL